MTSSQSSRTTYALKRGPRPPVRDPVTGGASSAPICSRARGAATARPHDVNLCVICHGPLDGPSLLADDSGSRLHPGCLAERLPYDTTAALFAAAALFLIPFIRVWSA